MRVKTGVFSLSPAKGLRSMRLQLSQPSRGPGDTRHISRPGNRKHCQVNTKKQPNDTWVNSPFPKAWHQREGNEARGENISTCTKMFNQKWLRNYENALNLPESNEILFSVLGKRKWKLKGRDENFVPEKNILLYRWTWEPGSLHPFQSDLHKGPGSEGYPVGTGLSDLPELHGSSELAEAVNAEMGKDVG